MSDEELQSDIAWFIHLSQKFERIAKELGVVFVDTGMNYTNTIQTTIAQL